MRALRRLVQVAPSRRACRGTHVPARRRHPAPHGLAEAIHGGRARYRRLASRPSARDVRIGRFTEAPREGPEAAGISRRPFCFPQGPNTRKRKDGDMFAFELELDYIELAVPDDQAV